jgi:hypothetical protein
MTAVLVALLFVLLVVLHRQVHGLRDELRRLTRRELHMERTMDDLLTEMRELPTLDESLDALFALLAPLIQAGKTDPAKLDEAFALVTAHKEKVKADILANTPAAQEPPITP